jgi:hypothetical protein
MHRYARPAVLTDCMVKLQGFDRIRQALLPNIKAIIPNIIPIMPTKKQQKHTILKIP